jgi:hypothetical protein
VEAKPYKLVRSLNQTERVRLQADFVSNDLELYEIGLKQLPCHACSFYRFVRTETAGSIRKNSSLGLSKQIPKRLAGIRQAGDLAPQRDREHRGISCTNGIIQQGRRLIAGSPEQ